MFNKEKKRGKAKKQNKSKKKRSIAMLCTKTVLNITFLPNVKIKKREFHYL